jgi:hypothetical protein
MNINQKSRYCYKVSVIGVLLFLFGLCSPKLSASVSESLIKKNDSSHVVKIYVTKGTYFYNADSDQAITAEIIVINEKPAEAKNIALAKTNNNKKKKTAKLAAIINKIKPKLPESYISNLSDNDSFILNQLIRKAFAISLSNTYHTKAIVENNFRLFPKNISYKKLVMGYSQIHPVSNLFHNAISIRPPPSV